MELKSEDRLLLDCLGAEDGIMPLGPENRLRASVLKGTLEQALRHYLTPLLYQRLKRFGSSGMIRADTMQSLRESYFQNAARNIRLYHHLSRALKTLNHAGIPVIVLKGAHLAEVVYRKAGERVMEDVDVLFRKNDLALCMKRLKEAGYYPYSSQLPLDIHWDINLSIPESRRDTEGIWERARPEVIGGIETLVLSPEDLLLHLCIHLSCHHLFRFAGLRTLWDIKMATLYYGNKIDWERLQRGAKELGAGNALFLTLILSKELLKAAIPEGVLKALKPAKGDPGSRSWALCRIFGRRYAEAPLSPYFWQLWRPGTLGKKLDLLIKLLFTPPEFISQRYPATYGSAGNYLYYIVRLHKHLSRYTRATWRMIRNENRMGLLAEQEKRDMSMRKWLTSS